MKFWQALSFEAPEQLVPLAQCAEQAGFSGVLLADHLFFPGCLQSKYPYTEDGAPGFDGNTPFPDPLACIAALAQATTTLRFATMVYILPLRHPVAAAKSIGTTAQLCGGRLVLGVGAGWVREEFDALNIPFESRGRRMDEMLVVMRKLWSGEMVEHQGEHFQLPPMQMTPAPQHKVPVYFGGTSNAALRRAARDGDGWFGPGNTPEQAAALLGKLHALRREFGRSDAEFETLAPLFVPPDLQLLKKLEAEHGMTSTNTFPFVYTLGPQATLQQKREQMLRFGETFIRQME